MSVLFETLKNGKRGHIGDLEEVLPVVLQNDTLLAEVVEYAASEQANIASRAAWILRKIAETDAALFLRSKSRLLNRLTLSPQWEAKAELCHIIPKLSLTKKETEQAIRFFEACQTDASKIVRAWSLNGLYELSSAVPSIIPRVLQMVQTALNDDAPAIRARARNIMKAVDSAQLPRTQKKIGRRKQQN